ncbi:MAG: 4'-phosphopantetheinyl transferase superfamily protein [Myxococcota bacterium]|nr:4'-phosphopantetheinyl transferase superfamily protein [Myxococcota bacterium]
MSAEQLENPDLPGALRPASDWTADAGCIDVWHVDLAGVAAQRLAVLSASERERAARREKLRGGATVETFGASRAALREILAGYLGSTATDLVISVAGHGRPKLEVVDGPELDFNISHTGRHALVAVCTAARVGVDIETLDRSRDVEAVAARFFTQAEQHRVLSAEDVAHTFYRMWTCKEAYLKAVGTGLSRSPRSFEIDLGDTDGSTRGWRVGVLDTHSADGSTALLCELGAQEDRVASLCVLDAELRLRLFDAGELIR